MLKAVIFDFDGVITDSEILHFRAFNSVLEQHGLQISKQEYYKNYLGFTDADCFKALISEDRLAVEPSQIQDLIRDKTRIFEELARREGSIIEGVRPFLALLRQSQVPLAICSGALRAEIAMILEEAQLHDYFDAIVSADKVERGKPHPDGFLLALKELNDRGYGPIAPAHCVVIEDSHWGLQAARAAGMRSVAVTNSYEAEQLKTADRVVERLDELTLEDLTQLCS